MNTDWLAQLAPEHAPPPPNWWPLAPGWWGLCALFMLFVVVAAWWWRNPQRRKRRIALRELQRIRDHASDNRYAIDAIARAIENLLRRYAIAIFGHDRVAQLSGNTWLSFVIDHGGASLAGASGRSLLAVAFGGTLDDDSRIRSEEWFAGAEAFLRRAGPQRKRGVLP